MYVEPDDLIRSLTGRGGGPLEHLLRDLLILEARAVGLGPTDVDWDQRINRPDGGRDIVVRRGCDIAESLIPALPSIWSAKGGDNARQPSLLQSEVEDHAPVVEHLNGGGCYRYVVLQPCGHDQREALRQRAREIERSHGWQEGVIDILFIDHLTPRVAACPTLIPHHLPDVAYHLGPGATASQQWVADLRATHTPFAALDSRASLSRLIVEVLNGEAEARFLHIAGWSGVGKSRLVAEAVADSPCHQVATVYQQWEDFEARLLPFLRSGQITSACIVVDEVDIRHVPQLADLCRNRVGVRIISIGTADPSDRHHSFVHILERPSSEELVAVVQARSSGAMTHELIRSISDLADGDFRLAEMLHDAAEGLGGTRQARGGRPARLRGGDPQGDGQAREATEYQLLRVHCHAEVQDAGGFRATGDRRKTGAVPSVQYAAGHRRRLHPRCTPELHDL